MSEIKMKIEKETDKLKGLCEKITDKLVSHLDSGFDQVDAGEVGAVVDMIKDLAEAKEKTVKAMYYSQLMDAMEDSEYGKDYDEDGPIKYYRGRSATTGRYVHRPYTKMMDDRDMDRDAGRMYYTPEYAGNMPATLPSVAERPYTEPMRMYESRYDRTKRAYEETKEMHPGSDEMDNAQAGQTGKDDPEK